MKTVGVLRTPNTPALLIFQGRPRIRIVGVPTKPGHRYELSKRSPLASVKPTAVVASAIARERRP